MSDHYCCKVCGLRDCVCPKQAFENPTTIVTAPPVPSHAGYFSFSSALELLKAGKRVARAGWNGKGMWVKLQRPTDKSMMTLPYIYMKTADNQLVPWLISQTDALANDWELVP